MTNMMWIEWRQIIEGHNLTNRKFRLFSVACCHEVKHLLTDPRSAKAVDIAERYADGNATEEELQQASTAAAHAAYAAHAAGQAAYAAGQAAYVAAGQAAYVAAEAADAAHAAAHVAATAARAAAHAAEAALTAGYSTKTTEQRLILVLNSFTHPITNPELKTSIATNLAHNIYTNKHFYLMPILADALQDAGCDDQALLAMLQNPDFPHRRGSNVLDFLTNKA